MRGVWQGFGIGIALIPLAGCTGLVVGYPPPAESWPGPPRTLAVIASPSPPAVTLDMPDDLASDPEAQRFHVLRRLAEAGAVAPEDAAGRRNANLGALLPYSAPPPAAGLARPAPLLDLAAQAADLSIHTDPSSRAAYDMLLDGILPAEPKLREPAARRDAEALKLGRDRLDRLAGLGLVTPDETARELDAIAQDEQVLANAPPPPPPPPPPPKKKPVRKTPPVGSDGGAKPGDVPGGAIPPKGKGPLGLHLLSMASDTMTDKAIAALKKEYPELDALTFKAVKTEIPDLGTTYRLLAGPVPAESAQQMCKDLRAKGQSCAVAEY